MTDQVVLRSKAPVLVIRSDCWRAEDAGAVRFGSVLVPLDRSELSESVLEHAVNAARLFDAELRCREIRE